MSGDLEMDIAKNINQRAKLGNLTESSKCKRGDKLHPIQIEKNKIITLRVLLNVIFERSHVTSHNRTRLTLSQRDHNVTSHFSFDLKRKRFVAVAQFEASPFKRAGGRGFLRTHCQQPQTHKVINMNSSIQHAKSKP